MTPRRRPSLAALALLLLLLASSCADAASPLFSRARSLFGTEEGKAAAAPAPSSPPPTARAAAAETSTTAANATATTATALCADDGPEGCGALVIQPPAAKAALKDYVDCITDPAAAGEACVRRSDGNGSGNNGNETDAFSSSASAKAESDPKDACPDEPLFDDQGAFSAEDWGAVAEKVRRREMMMAEAEREERRNRRKKKPEKKTDEREKKPKNRPPPPKKKNRKKTENRSPPAPTPSAQNRTPSRATSRAITALGGAPLFPPGGGP